MRSHERGEFTGPWQPVRVWIPSTDSPASVPAMRPLAQVGNGETVMIVTAMRRGC